jgi:hypothetical protein
MNATNIQFRPIVSLFLLSVLLVHGCHAPADPLSELVSPILFQGDDSLAYRDPAILYHGEGLGKENSMDTFVANCSLGIAWSDDLVTWDWPGKVDQ